MSATPQLDTPGEPSRPTSSSSLSPLEVEAIDLFISLVRLLGMPKSVGELYGLLFVSPEALPMDALMERLDMSKGAASQGLKLLRSFGAVKTVYVAGDRRDHYLAEFDLSRFATGFIKGEFQPHLDSGLLRLRAHGASHRANPGGATVARWPRIGWPDCATGMKKGSP